MIGKNISELRKSKGYNLSELAELANISKSYLSNIERNNNRNPSIEVIQRIANVLKVDFETLLTPVEDLKQQQYVENEWNNLFKELKELGIEKNDIKEYKTLIEFIKWQKRDQV